MKNISLYTLIIIYIRLDYSYVSNNLQVGVPLWVSRTTSLLTRLYCIAVNQTLKIQEETILTFPKNQPFIK